ncbi:uncharacterized protein BXZ73DRAFT_99303 [Epithele typhae]|uniref:uncharacterized protein n=1 Tax=Epithele typhae TaxID=378194 RepID=UPI002008572F|nr:uncharacterized protein BXZ73DRAFT_111995 [Epithele typhae]XP_047880004.1 uncharacterized protein BXZ73DRAFT_99303 [Epithele typhae]KAH9892215.1 hypothetical protein BXZ73DRAFT_111995 [Epithele typhae]KAH9939685.1 hypothetical protein BXZ73DRAFT_99303 [Epithele typhae]
MSKSAPTSSSSPPAPSDIGLGDPMALPSAVLSMSGDTHVSDAYLNSMGPSVDTPSIPPSDTLAALSELYNLGTDTSPTGASAHSGKTYGELMVAATRRLVPPARWASMIEELAEYHRSLVIAELLDTPRPSTISPRTHAILVETLFAGADAGVSSLTDDREQEGANDTGVAGPGAAPVGPQMRTRTRKRKGKGKGKGKGVGRGARADTDAGVDAGVRAGVVGATPTHPSVDDELPGLITPVHSDNDSDASDNEYN